MENKKIKVSDLIIGNIPRLIVLNVEDTNNEEAVLQVEYITKLLSSFEKEPPIVIWGRDKSGLIWEASPFLLNTVYNDLLIDLKYTMIEVVSYEVDEASNYLTSYLKRH
jgi:hypothetical protein